MRNLLEAIVVAVLVAGTFTATYVLTSQPDEPVIAAETQAAPIAPSKAVEVAKPEVADPPLQWSDDEEETSDGESAAPPDAVGEARNTDQGKAEAEDAAPEPDQDGEPEGPQL